MRVVTSIYREANYVISKAEIEAVIGIIEDMSPEISKNCVSSMRKEMLDKIMAHGWCKKAGLSHKSKINISGYKDAIGLCVQTGNVSRIYADLLKLQALWTSSKITAGIIIVPVSSNAKVLGSNLASFERLNTELEIFSRVITMPLYVIGFDGLKGEKNAREPV